MPPKKKNPKNAFWFFAMDWKLDKEQGGQRFSNMKEVMDLCSSDWQHLPEHIKAFYKKKEKEAKKRSKEDTSGKYNSLGISFDEIDKKKGEEEMAHEKMCDFIDTTIKSISVNVDTLKKHYFYLVHVNSYCYWEAQNVYIPCEVAISKFNIQDGVVDVYHVFPSPLTENGDIPTGYRYQATSSTEKVHSIPCPKDWDRTEFDWDKIRVDIFKFLRPNRDDAIPPVYTLNEGTNLNCEMQAVSDFFELLTDGSDVEFLVYSLPKLFHQLYLSCYNMASELFKGQINVNSAFPVEGVAHAQLIKDIYNFSPGIACSFHEGTNHYQNCSLSFVRRWVYLICEFCCNVLKVSLVPGRHCIHNADIAHQELSQPKPPSKPSSQKNERRDNTASELHYGMKNLSLPDKTSTNDGWTPVPGPQKTRKTSSRDSEELLLIDHSKVPDPALTRVLKSGQSPHVVSEVMPSTSVRLPTSRGRGELMAEMLRQQSPGASFSSNDFPGLGESRPGRADKPTPAGWGRGFSK